MEIVTECGTSILSTIVEDLVKSTGRQVGYIFRFKSIIEDLNKEAESLRSAQVDMQSRVDIAIKNTEEIDKKVEDWMRDVTAFVADVEELEEQTREKKTCLNGLCPNLIWRYQMARRAQKKKSIMSKLKDDGKFEIISHPTTLSGINVFTQKDFMPSESTTYAFNLIIEALKDDKTNVVGLYGMGGVGKTTLAKAVVNKAKEEKIFNEVVMVVVSQTPNVRDIQDQLADFLNFKLEEKSREGRAERLYMRLKDEKKILIILDDIWEKFDLAIIGIPVDDSHKDCKIFLTTRREQVCIDMGCLPKIPLNVLNEEEGLVLFKRHSGLNDDHGLAKEVEISLKVKLAKEVVEECKGLPLAIVAIGSALKEQPIDEWEIATQKLRKSKLMDVDIVDEKLYACLKLSYDYLKNEKTKSCFLLCSLFPEDHEIDLEQLVIYGLGLGLYQNTDSIEEARSELRVMVNRLKASSLLLDAEEGHVKMHDVVRDVALWITSKGKEVFMVKAGMGLTEWPKHEGLEQCTAISLLGNLIEVLPDGLVCPKMKILLLEGKYVEVSKEFFEEMKTLKVASLNWVRLSLNSLQSLTNLVTLQLIDCELSDISSIKKLAQLEIFRLKGSRIVELPEELGELSKLSMLDITDCISLKRIPVNVIPRLSRLEELYIGENSFKAWEVEGTSAEGSNASLSELSKLYSLTTLSLCINVQPRLLKDFVLTTNLRRYCITVSDEYEAVSYPKSRTLTITDTEVTSLVAFKALYENVEYLQLEGIKGCCQNMVPSIDATGLNELKTLSLQSFDELECIIDTTQQQKYVFQPEGLCYAKENPFLLSSLESLHLFWLQNLRYIWKGPTQQVSLQSLTVVEVKECYELRYIFTLSLARSLLQLEQLTISGCFSLEHIVSIKAEENVGGEGGNDVMFPKLRILQLDGLENFINFFDSENYSSTWPALQALSLCLPLNSTTSFVAQLEANVLQTSKEKLRVLSVGIMSDQLCNSVLTQLIHGFQNLEELTISDRPVQVLSQLELSLPSLKVLELWHLKELECLCKGPTHLLSLPNLKILKVYLCDRLRHMFSPSLARNLLQLEELSIGDCGELEQIFSEDDVEYNQTLSKDHLQWPLLFPSLSSIVIRRCDKLKSLFPVSMTHLFRLQNLKKLEVYGCNRLRHMFSPSLARNLLQLEELIIGYCKELVQIFNEDDAANMTSHREMVLPQLQRLTLQQLASLVNFCPVGYHFIFPTLSKLMVTKCPKLTTRFSIDQNRSMHAETEAPQTCKEDIDMEQSHPKTTREIECWGPNSIKNQLPPYIRK